MKYNAEGLHTNDSISNDIIRCMMSLKSNVILNDIGRYVYLV